MIRRKSHLKFLMEHASPLWCRLVKQHSPAVPQDRSIQTSSKVIEFITFRALDWYVMSHGGWPAHGSDDGQSRRLLSWVPSRLMLVKLFKFKKHLLGSCSIWTRFFYAMLFLRLTLFFSPRNAVPIALLIHHIVIGRLIASIESLLRKWSIIYHLLNPNLII